jgi:ion channel-forming bestrophin family protein
MVNYNPKDWSFFIFKMHKADTARKLAPMLVYMAVYSFVIIYLLRHFLPHNFVPLSEKLVVMHTLLGFVISMLLVFRTNTAYDRWWEGRKVWGALINTSRNLYIKFNNNVVNTAINLQLNNAVANFANALKNHLRKDKHIHATTKHEPLAIANEIYKQVVVLNKTAQLNDTQFLTLNNDIQLLMDYTGMCERIKNTPIPYIYNMFIKKFIFIYTMSMPFALAFNLSYVGIVVTVLMFYVLASLETIAEEIEDPFGNDSNDLALDTYVKVIEKSCNEMNELTTI